MKTGLTLFSLLALAALVGVSIWASAQIGITPAIRELLAQPTAGTHPWFIATLFDAYFAFLWFGLWVAFKETSNLARGVWLLLILLLGNIAMAAYVLLQLRRLPPNAGIQDLLTARSA